MSKINVLGNEISDLIAAGEVVERPASVVKELVENSIDAGSTKITIEIREGGIEYIRVTDNGCGMSCEDAKKAFLKHATSKISQKDDLFSIHTLGFRGEALAAISAVSKVSLKTKEAASVSGYAIEVEGGKIESEYEIGTSDGTTFEVRNLFFNTPARLKFVKSEAAERAIINALVEKLAISHSNISFTYITNGVTRFFTQGNGNLRDAVFSVFGQETVSDLSEVKYSSDKINVSGFTGRPLANKANRNFQIFFVNGRLVKSKILQQSLEVSYRNSMLVGRYPICILFIDIDTSSIDVNVHPSKLEIKFSDEKTVAEAVSAAIRESLSKESGIYSINIEKKDSKQEIQAENQSINESLEKYSNEKTKDKEVTYSNNAKPEPEYVQTVKKIKDWEIIGYKRVESFESPKNSIKENKQSFSDYTYRQSESTPKPVTGGELRSDPIGAMEIIRKYAEQNLPNVNVSEIEEDLKLINDKKAEYKFIGEAFSSYIIVEENEELIFIDKHALHERMIFEKLKKHEHIEVQTLLAPRLINLGDSISETLLANKDKLKTIGFDIEDFGGSIMIREIPVITEAADIESLLNSFGEELNIKSNIGDEVLDSFLYTIACKAAIKSGWKTSEAELRSIVDDYMNNRNNLKYCPHGRPIVFTLSKKAMEKQFKRIV